MPQKILIMITQEQRNNLVKTTIYMLQDTVAEFKMFSFHDVNDKEERPLFAAKHTCGTSCCLAGYGPAALNNATEDHSWWTYCEDTFGAVDNREFCFLFDSDWPDDRLEAGARVVKFLSDPVFVDKWNREGEEDLYDYDVRFHSGETAEELIATLRTFIVE